MRKTNTIFIVVILLLACTNSPGTNSQGTDEVQYRWVDSSVGLRFRETPGVTGKKLGLIPYANRVIFLEEKAKTIEISRRKGKWTKVKWNNKQGWVFGGFLTSENRFGNLKRIVSTSSIPYDRIDNGGTVTLRSIPSGSMVELLGVEKDQFNKDSFARIKWEGTACKIPIGFLRFEGNRGDQEDRDIRDVKTFAARYYKIPPGDISAYKVQNIYLMNFIYRPYWSHLEAPDPSSSWPFAVWYREGSSYKEIASNLREDAADCSVKILHINNDSYLDFILECGREAYTFTIALGTRSGKPEIIKKFESDLNRDYMLISTGKCGETRIKDAQSRPVKVYEFDCKSNTMVLK